jgi:uncharacterized protein YkuJ
MSDYIKQFLKIKTKICPKRLNKKISDVNVISVNPETGKEKLYAKIYFDFNGNRIVEKKYYNDKVTTWTKYIYKDNELSEVLQGKRDWNNGSNNENDFLFTPKKMEENGVQSVNEKGYKIISTSWLTGEPASKKIFNEKEICIEFVQFSKNGGITKKEIYDANGQMIENRRFKADGTPLNYTVNYFDDKGRLCRSDSTSKKGELTDTTIIKYDSIRPSKYIFKSMV